MANKKTIECSHCKRALSIKGPFHAGFSNQGFLYCNRDSSVLVFDTYNRYYVRIIPEKHPWMLSEKEKHLVEANLAPCPCGGDFRFSHKLRCPYCGKSLEQLTDTIHYVVMDNKIVNGNKASAWSLKTQGKAVPK